MQRRENNRTIHFLPVAACLVFGCHLLLAQSDISRWPEFHRNDLSKWAAKTGKSVRFLNELTKTATREDAKDVGDGDFPYTIENVDTQSLSQRGQILLSTWAAGTGHCLTLYVLKREGSRFEKVWQSYDNLCTRSILGAAETRAVPNGRIIVKYRKYSADSDPKKDALPILRVAITYKWDGAAYINAGRTERPEPSVSPR